MPSTRSQVDAEAGDGDPEVAEFAGYRTEAVVGGCENHSRAPVSLSACAEAPLQYFR